MSPGWPNGETRQSCRGLSSVFGRKRTLGTETSQYREEEKSTEMALVAASERAR